MNEHEVQQYAETERVELALAIVNSEAFMWLMVGANHQESWLSSLRPAYERLRTLGGGWGMKPHHDDGTSDEH